MTKRNPPKRILFVEGYDDKHFVKNFCDKILDEKLICNFRNESSSRYDNHNSRSVFHVDSGDRTTGGLNQMIDRAMEEITQQDREALGIIADANGLEPDNANHSWKLIKTRLEENLEDVTLPERLPKEGLILPKVASKESPLSTLRVGIWLMPDNQSSGELENFFAGLIQEDNATWKLARKYICQYIESMKQTENQQGGFDVGKPYKASKAKVYAWLATRKKPGKMGAAISAGHGLDFDSELAQRFARWLEDLFCF